MIQDLLEIVVAYYQYLASILQTKGVRYSFSWIRTGESMSFVSLDEAFFTENIPDVTADARIFFIVVSIILPLLLIFLGLVTFNEPIVVIWYFLLLASVFTLIAGGCAAIISQTIGLNISFFAAQILMYIGAGGLLLCCLAYLCRRLNRSEKDDELDEAVDEAALEARRELERREAAIAERDAAAVAERSIVMERSQTLERTGTMTGSMRRESVSIAAIEEDMNRRRKEDKELEELRKAAAGVVKLSKKEVFKMQTRKLDVASFVQGVVMGLLALGSGIVLIIGAQVVGIDAGALGAFAFIIGVTACAIGGCVLLWTLPSVARKGREAKWHVSNFIQENGMRLLILLIMILYIPIGSSSIVIFNCNEYTCPEGYRLVDQGTSIVYNWTTRSGSTNGENPYCYPCNPPTDQLAPAALVRQACDYRVDSRLESAPEIRCLTMQRFFWPAAGLAFVYILGVPFMYYRLIKDSCAVLKDDFPVDPKLDDWEQIWEAKIVTSENVAKFLYQPFEYKYRFWRLAQLMQKLGIVITGTYVFATPWEDITSSTISLGSALLIHVCMSIALFITEPFIRLYDDGVSTTLHACLVTCCIVAFCVLYDLPAPEPVNIALIAVYLALPLILFIVGVRLELRWAREAEEAAEEEQRRRVVEHLERMDADQMRACVEERRERLLRQREERERRKEASGNPLGGTEEPEEPSDDDPVIAPMDAERPVSQQEAARPMTAVMADSSDNAAGGYARSGPRTAVSAKAIAAKQEKKQGHAAPTFNERPGTMSGSRRKRTTVVEPGANTQSTASVDDGINAVTSPRVSGGKSMRKPSGAGPAPPDLNGSFRSSSRKQSTDGGGSSGPSANSSRKQSLSASAASPAHSPRSNEAASPSSASASSPTAAARRVKSLRVGRSTENPFEGSFRRSASMAGSDLSGSGNAAGSPTAALAHRRRSTIADLGASARAKRRDSADPFAASLGDIDGNKDKALRAELQGNDDDDDGLDIEGEDETAARLAEKRAALLAKVLKAEDARKKRRDMIRAGKITEEEAELAREARIEAVLAAHSGGDTMAATMRASELTAARQESLALDEDATMAASLDGTQIARADDALELELAEQALEVVEEQIELETRDMRERQGDVDLAMNLQAKKTVNKFLMVAGFIGFAALGCSLLGMLAANDDALVSTDAAATAQAQLGGKITWGFFATECACIPVTNDPRRLHISREESRALEIEVWVCDSGTRVERVRSRLAGDGSVESGTTIRPICGNSFAYGCEVEVTREEAVIFQCPANTTAAFPAATFALW